MAQPSNPGPSKPLKGGDYASGWWGEEEAKKGERVPGPYGQPAEVNPDAPDLQPEPGENRRSPPK